MLLWKSSCHFQNVALLRLVCVCMRIVGVINREKTVLCLIIGWRHIFNTFFFVLNSMAFCCKTCGLAFMSSACCENHQRSHHQSVSFQCWCGVPFTHMEQLRHHQSTRHNETGAMYYHAIDCEQCAGKSFFYLDGLRQYQAVHHPDTLCDRGKQHLDDNKYNICKQL